MCYCSVTILNHTFQFGLVFLLLFFPCDESVARLVQVAAISDTKGKHSPPHLVTKSRFVENLEYNLSFLASSLKSEFYHPDEKSLSKDPWRLTKPPCCRWIAFLQTHKHIEPSLHFDILYLFGETGKVKQLSSWCSAPCPIWIKVKSCPKADSF